MEEPPGQRNVERGHASKHPKARSGVPGAGKAGRSANREQLQGKRHDERRQVRFRQTAGRSVQLQQRQQLFQRRDGQDRGEASQPCRQQKRLMGESIRFPGVSGTHGPRNQRRGSHGNQRAVTGHDPAQVKASRVRRLGGKVGSFPIGRGVSGQPAVGDMDDKDEHLLQESGPSQPSDALPSRPRRIGEPWFPAGSRQSCLLETEPS